MRHRTALALLTAGAVVGVATYLLVWSPAEPLGRGEVGEVIVYGQIPFGPVALVPDEPRRLPRPQDFAFEFNSTGQGPRYLRIELEADGLSSVVFEDRFGAPADKYSLEFVLRIGDDYPDDVALIVTVEAPHATSEARRYPIQLIGPERPFWEQGQ